METQPLLILDHLAAEGVADKDWAQFFPAGWFTSANINGDLPSYNAVNGEVEKAAARVGWLLCFAHLSWYRLPQGPRSVEQLITGALAKKFRLFVVFVSDGRIRDSSDARKNLELDLQGLQGWHWTTSRLDFPSRLNLPSGSRHANANIAKFFQAELVAKLSPVAQIAEVAERQAAFVKIFEAYEELVDESLRRSSPDQFGPRDHAFRLYLLIKLARSLPREELSPGLLQVQAMILKEYPAELLSSGGLGHQIIAGWKRAGAIPWPLPAEVAQTVLADLVQSADLPSEEAPRP